jgi:Xaa-Pro aminopeptidase
VPSFDLNNQTLLHRQTQLLNAVAGHGFNHVLIFGYGSTLGAGSKSHGALRYLTGWDSHEAISLLILSKEEKILLVGSPFMVPAARQQLKGTKIIDMPPALWASYLRDMLGPSVLVGKIGFYDMPMSISSSITDTINNGESQDVDDHLNQMRLHNEEDALKLHEIGAGICDTLFAALKQELTPDKQTWEIQLALETKARSLGADYCKTWLTVRPCADYPRYWPEEGRNLPQTGDQILFGIALTVAGHWAHGIRMGSIGPTQEQHRSLWQQVMQMLEVGSAELTIGNSVRASEIAMNGVLKQHYTDAEITQANRFRNGHGLGMSYEDPLTTTAFPQHFGENSSPIVAPNADLKIQSTMLFELHPNIFLLGLGGAAIGEMLVATETGPKSLLKFPKELFVL